jgi:hypothetical protein
MDSKLNVKSALNQIFNRASNDFNFKNISYLPQWIILSVDMEWSFLWMFRLYLIESYWGWFRTQYAF